jgi:hypothetical protein|nr:MAG TPA: Fic family protein [Caudoviricetes sp.]
MSYIPISQTIKNSKKQYRDAYLYSEQHNHDITYFLVYIAKKTELAFKDFKKFIAKKREKQKNIYENLQQFGYNDRQNKLLTYFLKNPDSYTNAITHQNYYSISKATALKDLTILLEK